MVAGPEPDMVRVAGNKERRREAESALEARSEVFGEALGADLTWVCECADQNCSEPLRMTLDEHDRLRWQTNHFAVLRGHVCADLERVVTDHDGYVIVAVRGATSGVRSNAAFARAPRGRDERGLWSLRANILVRTSKGE